jgi:hypothetical protein
MSKITIFLWLAFMIHADAQTRHPAFDAIVRLDYNALLNLMDKKVEYSHNGRVAYLDKAEAIQAIRSFVEANPPKSINPLHKGASRSNESQYHIAQYTSTQGKIFRLTLYAEESGSAGSIQEFRIEPQ